MAGRPSGSSFLLPTFHFENPAPPSAPRYGYSLSLSLSRFRALVKQIKASANYDETIGQALGVEGAQQTGPDFASLQPNINATINGTQVDVGWDWSGFSANLDLIELVVGRSDSKSEVLLAYDTTPFPATPTKWTYRAIYRVGDSRVERWSKPVSVTVGG